MLGHSEKYILAALVVNKKVDWRYVIIGSFINGRVTRVFIWGDTFDRSRSLYTVVDDHLIFTSYSFNFSRLFDADNGPQYHLGDSFSSFIIRFTRSHRPDIQTLRQIFGRDDKKGVRRSRILPWTYRLAETVCNVGNRWVVNKRKINNNNKQHQY